MGSSNRQLSFTPLKKSDISLLFKWVGNEHVFSWWQDEKEWDTFYKKYYKKCKSSYEFPHIIFFNNTPIGFIEYYFTDKVGNNWWPEYPAGTVGIDIFIGEPNFAGKGLGSIILKQMLSFIFSKLNVSKVIVDPGPDNIRAIKCYKKAGFLNGRLTQTPMGQALVMEITKENFLKQNGQECNPCP
jgi:RimJ/RimL family protein N-acetyltransferase